MSQLEIPPKKADERFDQWIYLLWRYLNGTFSPDNAGNIIEERVFRQRDLPAGGVDVANAQLVEAIQAFSQHANSQLTMDMSSSQPNILANQIFGG